MKAGDTLIGGVKNLGSGWGLTGGWLDGVPAGYRRVEAEGRANTSVRPQRLER